MHDTCGMTAHRPAAAYRLHHIGGLDHSELQSLLGYNLAQASIPAYGLYEEFIGKPLALRQVEFSVLVLLATNSEVKPNALSAGLGIAASNLTVILDRLEKRGLIGRTRSTTDRRAHLITLTTDGQRMVEQASDVSAEMEAQLRASFSGAEWAMLLELLQRASLLRRVAEP